MILDRYHDTHTNNEQSVRPFNIKCNTSIQTSNPIDLIHQKIKIIHTAHRRRIAGSIIDIRLPTQLCPIHIFSFPLSKKEFHPIQTLSPKYKYCLKYLNAHKEANISDPIPTDQFTSSAQRQPQEPLRTGYHRYGRLRQRTEAGWE